MLHLHWPILFDYLNDECFNFSVYNSLKNVSIGAKKVASMVHTQTFENSIIIQYVTFNSLKNYHLCITDVILVMMQNNDDSEISKNSNNFLM